LTLSSTDGDEEVNITDCYSKSGDQDSREAEAKGSKKQPVKDDCCTSLNVPRLDNATVSLETSSSVSVINFDVFSGSEKEEGRDNMKSLIM